MKKALRQQFPTIWSGTGLESPTGASHDYHHRRCQYRTGRAMSHALAITEGRWRCRRSPCS